MTHDLEPAMHWEARDPARNIARAYGLHVERDLFGWFVVEQTWGRIGARGRSIVTAHPTADLADMAIRRVIARRMTAPRRLGTGYVRIS